MQIQILYDSIQRNLMGREAPSGKSTLPSREALKFKSNENDLNT